MKSIGCTVINMDEVAIAEDRIALYERIAKSISGQEDPRTAQVVRMYLDIWTQRLEIARSGKPMP